MTPPDAQADLNRIAESYVKLVLAVGQHDPDYVDAYYGPEPWKTEATGQARTLHQIQQQALDTQQELARVEATSLDPFRRLRYDYLRRQLQALVSRVELLGGKKMTFDEESLALYDAVAPAYPEEHFQEILRDLDALLPGKGAVSTRYNDFKKEFIIPTEKLDLVFSAAISESRARTGRYIPLPENESFTLEYVKNKSWSGYNWYKGKGNSLIQINTDLPIFIDRAVDLASHEGYPGHHVYNALCEHHLVNQRQWMEFTVYALFSPQSLIAEGTANFGIDMAFPSDERVHFERTVLFPLAGLDPATTDLYYRIHAAFLKLSYAGNESARRYLDGTIGRDEAARWLIDYALMSPERAQQRTRFFDQYRSYVINYNLGQDMVREYIESRGGTTDNPQKRWAEFALLISSPRLPSGLRQHGA